MDLKQLEYFVRVAELGSFTRASIALNIAQPALSRQVRMLEVELRQTLLIRNGRGATATEAGKLLLEHARGILHQVERAREAIGRVRGALTGRVAVGLPPSIARSLSVPLIREFRQRMPEARLSIMEGLSSSMREALTTGRMDIALMYNAQPAPELELTQIAEEDLFLVQARMPNTPPSAAKPMAKSPAKGTNAHRRVAPLPLKELAALPLVIPTRPNAIRMQVEAAITDLGLRPKIALEIDAVSAILELVADGAGNAVLTRNAVATSPRPETFELRPIGSPRLRSRLLMAVSSQRPTTLTQQATLDLIRELTQRTLAR